MNIRIQENIEFEIEFKFEGFQIEIEQRNLNRNRIKDFKWNLSKGFEMGFE